MSETKGHDPLCPDYPHARRVVCQCDLIARVRADEVERRFGWVEAWFHGAYETSRERHANDPDNRHYWEGFRDALDKAEQGVLALFPGEVSE